MESETFFRTDRTRIVSREIALLVNMADKTSWLKQALGAFNANDKDSL